MKIIDAHHHLWDLNRFPYPWLTPVAGPRPFGDHSKIKIDYFFDQYLTDTKSEEVTASVLVQANSGSSDPVAEVKWFAEEAQRAGRQVAIVGQADIFSPSFEDDLDRQMEIGPFRGVRIFAGWDEDLAWSQTDVQDVILSKQFLNALEALKKRGLILDLAVRPKQLRELAKSINNLPHYPSP